MISLETALKYLQELKYTHQQDRHAQQVIELEQYIIKNNLFPLVSTIGYFDSSSMNDTAPSVTVTSNVEGVLSLPTVAHDLVDEIKSATQELKDNQAEVEAGHLGDIPDDAINTDLFPDPDATLILPKNMNFNTTRELPETKAKSPGRPKKVK